MLQHDVRYCFYNFFVTFEFLYEIFQMEGDGGLDGAASGDDTVALEGSGAFNRYIQGATGKEIEKNIWVAGKIWGPW